MMILKKALPRRTFLRGMGSTIALPLLDAMVPAFASSVPAPEKTPVRLAIAYVPNGMWPMDKWTPASEGSAFELTPVLEPLAPFRNQLLVLSGLAHKEAIPAPGEPAGDHSRAFSSYLTGVRLKVGDKINVGVSVDQLAAQQFGKQTQLASLEMALFPSELVGACEAGLTCAFVNTLSWRTPTSPNPMETNPRAVFERMFGDADNTNPEARVARIRHQKSLLDWVLRDLTSSVKNLSPNDRVKLTEYLDAIRDVERRIQVAEAQSNREIPALERPVGVPASFDEYAKLMFDLQVVAFQADLTRVITFAMGREGPVGGRAYPEIDISDIHHTLSHHQNSAGSIERLLRINIYHMQQFAYFIDKLKSTSEGDGNLLDHTMLLYGAGLSDGNSHQHTNLPVLLLGGGGGQLSGGRHIRYQEGTAMTNLYLTLLEKMGVRIEKFGDSTDKLTLLSM